MTIDKRFYELIYHLWRGGAYGYYWTPDSGDGEKYTFWTARQEDVPKLFWDKDAYFGVHSSNIRRSEHERAKITDIDCINTFYVEYDCKTPESKKATLEKIHSLPIQPACIVDSGGGYHCYYWLRDTYHLDTLDKRQKAADLQWAFVQWAGGDSAVNDLARVLRIPGTQNRKPHFAPNYPTVTIVWWEPTQQYELSEIEGVLQPYIDARVKPVEAHAPVRHTVSLSDSELLQVLFRSKNGAIYEGLWRGNLNAHNGDHSDCDQFLCNGLAWLTGRDSGRMDLLFRQSGLYREKWETKSYRERTLKNAVTSAQTIYEPKYVDQDAIRAAEAAVSVNGNGSQLASKPETPPQVEGTYRRPSEPRTQDYIKALHSLGFYFRMNTLGDDIEVNGERLDDVMIRTLKNRMRDIGFKGAEITSMEDAYWEEAGKNRYHPIKDYLDSLRWDDDDHIRMLARHFKDKHPLIVYGDGSTETVVYVWLKRWLVGAVGKVYGGHTVNTQNAVLVLEGGQNLGKSTFARWLCSGMPKYFIEKSIDPDNKDDERRLATKWIWEIGELGATTRKADREALKSFLTREVCTFRNPYAQKDVDKAALSSFIGTVNNEGGFLHDATGTRRFMTVGLTAIEHSYITDIDIDQIWAQAFDLYRRGESWRLTAEETQSREELNNDYKVEDAYEGWIRRYFDLDPERGAQQTLGWFTSTQEIVSELKTRGVTGETHAITTRLPATMKELGFEKTRFKSGGLRGYWGVKIKPE